MHQIKAERNLPAPTCQRLSQHALHRRQQRHASENQNFAKHDLWVQPIRDGHEPSSWQH
jgi:hypothetical protein